MSDGPHVVTERLDTLRDADRTPLFAMDVLGIFELAGGRFVSWREYADGGDVKAQFDETAGSRS